MFLLLLLSLYLMYEMIAKIGKVKDDGRQETMNIKRSGTCGTGSQLCVINLLMLILLEAAERKIKFHLGTKIAEAEDFGDIVLKYRCESETKKWKFICIQVRHKDDPKKDIISIEKLFSESEKFYICKCFNSYVKSKKQFSEVTIFDSIRFEDVEFIIYTNALSSLEDSRDQEIIESVAVEQDSIFNFLKGSGKHFKLVNGGEDTMGKTTSVSPLDRELTNFLDRFKLFVDQPGEKELDTIVRQKIQKVYKVVQDDVDSVYSDAHCKILKWWKERSASSDKEYITEENKMFQNSRISPIKFDVTEPVTSFTGRIEQLKKLHDILENKNKAVISQKDSITGLGGIGKTELARKYISENSTRYDGNIIWINADNYLVMSESFRRLADRLKSMTKHIENKDMSIESIVSQVYNFFAVRKRKSLFVFDNAYSGYNKQDEGVNKFLPSDSFKPHVLITSRNQDWKEIEPLRLDVFTGEEAAEFIKKSLQNVVKTEENEVKRLSEKLRNFPIALKQAVSFIKAENGSTRKWKQSEFSIATYLEKYERHERELLGNEIVQPLFTTVLTTWTATIDKINKNRCGNICLEILNVIAYLAPDNIPIKDIFSNLYTSENNLNAAVELLNQYSLVNSRGGRLSIHRLEQEVIRIKLEEQSNNVVVKEVCKLLTERFPFANDTSEEIIRQKEMLPHLKAVLHHMEHLIAKHPEHKQRLEKDYLRGLICLENGYRSLGNSNGAAENAFRS